MTAYTITNEVLNKYFDQRQDFIYECAKNILKQIKRTDLTNELVSECFIYMAENQKKLKKQANEPFINIEAVCLNWMNKQVVWQKTGFKRKYIMFEDNLVDNDVSDFDRYILEEMSDEEVMGKEMEIQNKMNHVYSKYSTLDRDDKQLYQYVYVDGYDTSGKLKKHLRLGRTTCWKLKKELDNKLKDGFDEHGV